MSNADLPPGERPPTGAHAGPSFRPAQYGAGQQAAGPPMASGQTASAYPQQTLLPHEVKPSKSRKPLIIALVVALMLAVGGIVAWQLLKSNGESTRAAYCGALKSLTNNGHLASALSGAGISTVGQLNKVVSLAPDAVKSDWKTLETLATSAQSGNLGTSSALQALSAFNAIASDASSNCNLKLNVPGIP